MHALHLLGGVSALLVVWFKAWRSRKDELFELRNIINLNGSWPEVLTLFWHFVDGLLDILIFVYIFFSIIPKLYGYRSYQTPNLELPYRNSSRRDGIWH